MARWGSSALAGSLSSDGVTIKIQVLIQPYTYQLFYEMLQINESNQGDLNCLKEPHPKALQATTSGVGVSKLPRKTSTIYTRRKTKARRNLGEIGEK